ncbi:MAG: glycosyltransferase family 2 protein [Candidatus Micrarchaeales archaeon]|nr:glycosyltransferase family 2 protein [Candidatus Micrarchaeales archaeon]
MAILILVFYSYLLVISLYAVFSAASSLQRYRPERFKIKRKPRALVMVPCKGIDLTLNQNLRSLKNQTYRNYDLVAIVDDIGDSAVQDIRRAGIKMLLADRRFNKGSGKVNALSTAIDKYRHYDIYVIADSDIIAGKDWLEKLVAPFSDRRVGLSTAFPYFEPVSGFWSKVKMVWGFVGQGMEESNALRFGWGGSLAFPRKLLDGKSFEFFSGSLSDDIAITKLVKKRGLRMVYVPDAQPVVKCAETFSTFWEWANRQTAFAIRGNRNVFWAGILSYALSILMLLSAIFLTVSYSPAAALLFIPVILAAHKTSRRMRGKHNEFALLNAIMPFIFLANLVTAKRMRNIEWRGRSYSLSGMPDS